MNFKKLIKNPVDLGHKVIIEFNFSLTTKQAESPKVKGAIRLHLIEEIKPVKAPTKTVTTAV